MVVSWTRADRNSSFWTTTLYSEGGHTASNVWVVGCWPWSYVGTSGDWSTSNAKKRPVWLGSSCHVGTWAGTRVNLSFCVPSFHGPLRARTVRSQVILARTGRHFEHAIDIFLAKSELRSRSWSRLLLIFGGTRADIAKTFLESTRHSPLRLLSNNRFDIWKVQAETGCRARLFNDVAFAH